MKTPLHPTALAVCAVCLFLSQVLSGCYSGGRRPGSDDPDSGDTETEPEGGRSFIWIANSGVSTLSKVDTQTAVEVARYRTCSSACDPSRTSVNLHGDAVVTNREPYLLSVTKFAAAIDDCVDVNDNGMIETSKGPTDVLDWGQDECMLWHTKINTGFCVNEYGARATAWDGKEDPDTGLGGSVWVGTCGEKYTSSDPPQVVYKLDGDSGEVVDQTDVDVSCCYGGVVDGNDGFWVFDQSINSSSDQKIVRVDMNTLQVSEPVHLSGGYGITADQEGRVWVGGQYHCHLPSYVSRYDPSDGSFEDFEVTGASRLRGIAVGVKKSAGYVWAADTDGTLYKIDQENMIVAGTYEIGIDIDMIGAAVDFEGYVWTVDYDTNAAYKFNPDTETAIKVPVGPNPYTYSDMTGMQLKNVIPIE